MDFTLLHEQVLDQRGPVRTVRRWWLGHYADLGTLHHGLRGRETVEETTRVVPVHRVRVDEPA